MRRRGLIAPKSTLRAVARRPNPRERSLNGQVFENVDRIIPPWREQPPRVGLLKSRSGPPLANRSASCEDSRRFPATTIRGTRAAAPLKLTIDCSLYPIFIPIRGTRAAAPLKLPHVARQARGLAPIRGTRAAAPLKLDRS